MSTPVYDVAIVGAGIVGLATAHELLQQHSGLRVCIIEKEAQVAQHQTGHNSGVIHTGIYYTPGSMKASFCASGREKLLEFCQTHRISHEICGKVVVATDESELSRLDKIEARAGKNKVLVERLDARQLRDREPEARGLEALYVPGAGIVDYVQVAHELRKLIEDRGGEFYFDSKVHALSERDGCISVETCKERVRARFIVNCGGLQSDRLAQLGGAPNNVSIIPFRGEYYELNQEARAMVRALIYPVPQPEFPFLGVHFTRGIHGDVECGPNALLNGGRETYGKGEVDPTDLAETLTSPAFFHLARKYYRAGVAEIWRSLSKKAFVEAAQKLLPAIRAEHLSVAPAGIRAQAVSREGKLLDDFALHESEYVLSVINAPSPAATASLAIGSHLAQRVQTRLSP